jgi:hypothetical protein
MHQKNAIFLKKLFWVSTHQDDKKKLKNINFLKN